LAHPGGNATGVGTVAATEEYGKRLELLKQAVPLLRSVVVVGDLGPTYRSSASRQALEIAARVLRLELFETEVTTLAAAEAAIANAKQQGAQAVYMWPGPFTYNFRRELAHAAIASRLPSLHLSREGTAAGGLLSYAASNLDIARRGAVFVDKIARGTKPANLPVELPTKRELVINMKTAKLLGLTIPRSLLLRADEIIE
jgi:putative ABC transport system substrate-binding protein